MAVINTNLTCDLQHAVRVQYLDGNIFSQDNQGNVINVTVFDGGEPATLSGTISANIIRADGSTVAATGGTITDNVASITLPAAAYAIPGVVSIVIKNTVSSVVTTIAAIVANVYQSSTDTVIDPGTIIPSVQTLISAIETAVASIPADYSSLWTSLAPVFSSSANYVTGQYVTNNGGLYRFTTAHSGSWSSSDVVAVNIGGDLSDLKSAFDYDIGLVPLTLDLTDKRNAYPTKNIGTEVAYNNSSATYTYVDIIPVSKGKKYQIQIKNGASPASVNNRDAVIVDSNDIIKKVIGIPTTAGKTNFIRFISEYDGTLILPVDKNYKTIEIYRCDVDILAMEDEISEIDSGNLLFADKVSGNTVPVRQFQTYLSNPYNGLQIRTNKSGAIRIKGEATTNTTLALTNYFTANAYHVYVKITGKTDKTINLGFYDGTTAYGNTVNVVASDNILATGDISSSATSSVYTYIFIPYECVIDITILLSNSKYHNSIILSPDAKVIDSRILASNNHELFFTGGDQNLLINIGVDYDRLCSMPYIHGGLLSKIDFDSGSVDFSNLIAITQNHYYNLPSSTITYTVNDYIQHFVYDYDLNEIRVYQSSYTGKYICLFSIYQKTVISPYSYLYYPRNRFPFPMKGELIRDAVIEINTTEQTLKITSCIFLLGRYYVNKNTVNISFTYTSGYAHFVYYDGTSISVVAETNTSGYSAAFQYDKIPLFYFYNGHCYGLNDDVKAYINGVLVHGSNTEGLDGGLSSKKMAFLGDSLTEGVGAGGNSGAYPKWIGDKLGCTSLNHGLSGSAITVVSGQTVTGFIDRVANIPDDCDIVAFMGGTNDYWQNVPLGQDGDTTSETFYGALAVLCETLQTRFPKAFIYAVAPPMGWQPNNNFDMGTKSNIGSFEDVNNAIKTVCRKYSIPVLDMMHDCSLNPKVDATKSEYFSDGVHLNAKGEKCIASMHIGFLRTHYRMSW